VLLAFFGPDPDFFEDHSRHPEGGQNLKSGE